MPHTTFLPNYSELESILKKVQPNSHAAQLHGLLCGRLCRASKNQEPLPWQVPSSQPTENQEVATLLQQITQSTYDQLNEFSFEFNLFLPEEEADINLRAQALGFWCQGFLTGFDDRDPSIQDYMTDEIAEALDDIREVAKISSGDIAENEEDETAYIELVEYIRLNILMIFHELQIDDAEEQPWVDKRLSKELTDD